MLKRVVILCLTLCLLCSLLPPGVWATEEKQDQKLQTIDALQSLLLGIRFNPNRSAKVSYWDDEVILESVYGKLLWEKNFEGDESYLEKMGIVEQDSEEDERCYHVDRVLQLAFDAYGRGFSKNAAVDGVRIDEDEMWISLADGEAERLYILDYEQMGDILIATGMAVSYYNTYRELNGYFCAEFKINAESIYGYTLLSLEKLSSDQTVTGLIASASGELEGEDNKYAAEKVVDGNSETAWLEGVDGVGVDEWIKLEKEDGSQFSVNAIKLELGYHKSKKTMERNGRPTVLRIEMEDGQEQTVEFDEYTDVVIFEEAVTTGYICFTILEAEAGSKYEDTAISEIRLSCVDSKAVFEEYREENSVKPEIPDRIETLYCGEVSVTRKPGFAPDTVLEAPVLTGEAEAEALKAFAMGELIDYAIYDLKINQGEAEDQKRMLEIRLPVPDQEREEGWMVYRIQDGTHTRVQYEYADGYVILRTRELGSYVVGRLYKGQPGLIGAATENGTQSDDAQQAQEEESIWSGPLIIIFGAAAVLLVVTCVLLIVIISKRKKNNEPEEE